MKATQQQPICPLSGKVMKPWILMPVDSITGKENAYNQLYWCEDSQYGAVVPLPDPQTLKKFYDLDEYYTHGRDHLEDQKEKTFFDKLRIYLAWRFEGGIHIKADYVNKVVCDGQPKDILEIGSGAGNLLTTLNSMGHRVCGIEPDPNAAVFSKNVQVYQGTAEEIPELVRSQSFDLVLMNHVLEHCLDPLQALANINSLLRPGGKFMCVVPNNASYCLQEAGATWQFLDVPRHLHFFTAKSLRDICEKSGLRVESTFFNSYTRQFSNIWIEIEKKIWDFIKASNKDAYPLPKTKMSKSLAWKRMLFTLKASDEKRYEAVGVIAVKP